MSGSETTLAPGALNLEGLFADERDPRSADEPFDVNEGAAAMRDLDGSRIVDVALEDTSVPLY